MRISATTRAKCLCTSPGAAAKMIATQSTSQVRFAAGVHMTSFKVPCPSCEAKVLIKNPNLVGTKVECPKCKYRFKVEEAKDAAPAAAEAPSEPKKNGDGKG